MLHSLVDSAIPNHRTINSKQLLKSLKNLKIIRTFAHKVKNKRTKIYT